MSELKEKHSIISNSNRLFASPFKPVINMASTEFSGPKCVAANMKPDFHGTATANVKWWLLCR